MTSVELNYTDDQRQVLDHLAKGVSLLEQVILNARIVTPEREHKHLEIASLHLEQLAVMVSRALAHAAPIGANMPPP